MIFFVVEKLHILNRNRFFFPCLSFKLNDIFWECWHGRCFWISDRITIENWHKISYKRHLIWPDFNIFWLYVPDFEKPSFGQACSISIPMNINAQWKIALETIPRLKLSPERILIAMDLWRKNKIYSRHKNSYSKLKPRLPQLAILLTGETWVVCLFI